MAKTSPFDAHSEEYDRWFDDHGPLYEAELKALYSVVPKTGDGLEIGVGSGKFAAPLGVRTGVEPSQEMAKKARIRGIEVHPGVAENLPFPDKQFDYALMVTTICFVDDIQLAFKEARRVLKEDGMIVLGFVDRESEIGRAYLKRKHESVFYKDATFYSTEEVLVHLEQSGFTDPKVLQTLFADPPIDAIRPGYGSGSFVVITCRAHNAS